MRKILAYGIPVLVLGLFLLIMGSASILKKPLDRQHRVSSGLNRMESLLVNREWNNASSQLVSLKQSLNRSFKVLQFSVERDEITHIITNLDRIQGFIRAKDKGNALGELYEAKGRWREIGQ